MMRPTVLTLMALPVALTVAACGSSSSGAEGSSTPSTAGSSASASATTDTNSVATADLKVALGEGSCDLNSTILTAGQVTVTATSSAAAEGEVYLYGQENGAYTKILGEVEGLTSGLTKSFTAEVPAGSYEVKCEAGGTEMRVPVTAK